MAFSGDNRSYTSVGKLKGARLFILSAEDIEAMSVGKITNDDVLGNDNGLMSLKFGPYRQREGRCQTCGERFETCPGHFGHIDLAAKVYNFPYGERIRNLLRVICHSCGDILLSDTVKQIYDPVTNDHFPLNEIVGLYGNTKLKRGEQACEACGAIPKINHTKITDYSGGLGILYNAPITVSDKDSSTSSINKDGKQHIFFPEETYQIFSRIPDDVAKFLGFKMTHPRSLILTKLAVIPPAMRPAAIRGESGNEKISDNIITTMYTQILSANKNIAQMRTGDPAYISEYINFALSVKVLFSTNKFGKFPRKVRTKMPLIGTNVKGIVDSFTGKEGIINIHMRGKRVNHCARSVISAEVGLDMDQVGIPEYIARILTFPEEVTASNIGRLSALVLNGANHYPGANKVINGETGEKISLGSARLAQSITLRPGDIVERHIVNDDTIIMTRQPSLNKNSFMSFRVFVIKDHLTLRLNLSVVGPFNADYDGDEMNLFMPRSLGSVVEARELMGILPNMSSEHTGEIQILPVQDSAVATALLTNDDVLLTWEQVMHIYSSNSAFLLRLSNPSKIDKKRGPMWTGKQVFSALLPELNFTTPNQSYHSHNPRDKRIVVENGELIQGILTKGKLTALSDAVFHSFSDKKISFDMVNQLGKMTNFFLQSQGVSFAYRDIYIRDKKMKTLAERTIDTIVADLERRITEMTEGKVIYPVGVGAQKYLETLVLQQIQGVLGNLFGDIIVPYVMTLDFMNNLFTLANIGTKGKPTNIGQIMVSVGMQHNDGRLIKRTLNGRITPYSHAGSLKLGDIGFVKHSLSDGMTPVEFFYSAVTGREGLLVQKGSTPTIGYSAKKVNQISRDNALRFDRSVRDNRGRIIQLLYGNNGFDPSRVTRVAYPFTVLTIKEMEDLVKFTPAECRKFKITKDHAEKEWNQLLIGKKMVINKFRTRHQLIENITFKMPVDVIRQLEIILARYPFEKGKDKRMNAGDIVLQVDGMLSELHLIFSDYKEIPEDRVRSSLILPKIYIKSCLAAKPLVGKRIQISERQFGILLETLWTKMRESLASPGSLVGMLSAFALTQPSQQMVIDSFHVSSLGEVRGEGTKLEKLKGLIETSPAHVNASYKIFIKDGVDPQTLLNGISDVRLSTYLTNSQVLFLPNLAKSSMDPELEDIFKAGRMKITEGLYSHFVIRFGLNRKILYHRKMSMSELKFMLEDLDQENNFFAVTSGVTIEEPFIYLYVSKDKVGALQNGRGDTKTCTLEVFRRLMKEIPLQNISKTGLIEHGMIKTEKAVEYDEETFEKKMVERKYIQGVGPSVLDNILSRPEIDGRTIVSTNIRDNIKAFGVEAAKRAFITELWGMLSAVAGGTSLTHIHLLADTVFYTGVQVPTTQEGAKRQKLNEISLLTFEKTRGITADVCSRGVDVSGDTQTFALISGQRSRYGGTGDLFEYHVELDGKRKQQPRELDMLSLFKSEDLDF